MSKSPISAIFWIYGPKFLWAPLFFSWGNWWVRQVGDSAHKPFK